MEDPRRIILDSKPLVAATFYLFGVYNLQQSIFPILQQTRRVSSERKVANVLPQRIIFTTGSQ